MCQLNSPDFFFFSTLKIFSSHFTSSGGGGRTVACSILHQRINSKDYYIRYLKRIITKNPWFCKTMFYDKLDLNLNKKSTERSVYQNSLFTMYQRTQNYSPVLAICYKTAMLHLVNLIICIKFPCSSRSISSSLIIYDLHWSLIGGLRLSLQSWDLLGEADFGGVGYSVEWERRRHSKCNSLTHFFDTL